MAQAVSNPGRIPKPVESQLAALRRKIATWFIVDGLSKVLLVACSVGAIDFLLDWQFHMDFAQRVIMLVLMAVAIIAASVRWMVRPFQKRPGDDSLCLEVERSHAELQESLISSVQFSRMPNDQRDGVSEAMVQATIQHGIEASRKINFADVLNAPRFRSNAALLASAVVVICLAGYAVAATDPGRIWFNRNILLGSMTWPQDVYLEIEGIGEDRTLRLVRGDNWIQHVSVLPTSEYVPDKVYIERRSGNPELMNRLHDPKNRRTPPRCGT